MIKIKTKVKVFVFGLTYVDQPKYGERKLDFPLLITPKSVSGVNGSTG